MEGRLEEEREAMEVGKAEKKKNSLAGLLADEGEEALTEEEDGDGQLVETRLNARRRKIWGVINLNGSVLALGFLVVSLIYSLLIGHSSRRNERGVSYASPEGRKVPRTGDIMLSSFSFNRLRNLMAGEVPAFWVATPANHAGLLYTPDGVGPHHPIYLIHRMRTGLKFNLVTDYAETYSVKILVRVEPAPPEDLILEGVSRQGNSSVYGHHLIPLYANWVLRHLAPKLRPLFMPNSLVSCSQTVVAALEYAGVCRCKVPLSTVIPHDLLFLNDPKRSILEPNPPYRFLPPVWLNPFGTAASVPTFDA
jgi:hypothetical protein